MTKLRVEIQEKVTFGNGTTYLKHKERLYRIRIWNNESFVITDMSNAGKRGTVCQELSINTSYGAPDCAFWNDLLEKHCEKLLEFTTEKICPSEFFKQNYFDFYLREVESKRLMPLDLSVIKPLKEEPKKWTLPHVIRAVVNGQYENLKCNYRHLDDTCQDFGKGKISDVINFAKKIIESPSGWWIHKNTDGVVSVCCHSFDSNEFVPKITTITKTAKKKTKQTKEKIEKPSEFTIEEAQEILNKEGVRIEKTMTTPKRTGKQPRPVWQVSGRTNGLEEFFYDLGCSRRRWKGMFSFWDSDPTIEIAKAINELGRLNFTEQQERKEDRAEKRVERFEQYSDNAQNRSNHLYDANKSLLDCMAGTPILIGHHSEKRHRRDLKRIGNRTRKSIEEGEKANYYNQKAESINYRLNTQKYDLSYLHNRITENEATLRKLERQKEFYSDYESRKQETEEKLSYFKNLRNEVIEEQKENGRIIPSPSTVDKGDEVKYRGTWYPVKRVNKKTLTISNWLGVQTFTWNPPFDEISDIKKSA